VYSSYRRYTFYSIWGAELFTPNLMAEANRDAAEQWAQRAMSALAERNLQVAAKCCEKSLRLNPDDARVQSLRDRIAAAQAGEASPNGRAASPQRSSAGAEHSHRNADDLRGSGASQNAPPAARATSSPAQNGYAVPPSRPQASAQARPQASAQARPQASAQARPAANAPVNRPHTPEQAASVRTIKLAADYYEVLGVTKDATPEDIKRVRALFP
jgi:hypothetical protein